MTSTPPKPPPPDQAERVRALDPSRSILVQAPAGSGKTDLLTRRFLTLLALVEDPSQIVAITFTKAAAAEMRQRILKELEKAVDTPAPQPDAFSLESLAHRALANSRRRGWRLIDLPAQLRISTIDAFGRELALQQPILAGLGGAIDPQERPAELYSRAARRALEKIANPGTPLALAIETLLLWRDNNWQELENLLVGMLQNRDRWMQNFVLEREPDWDALRSRLELPFAAFVRNALSGLDALFQQVPGALEQALALARFACSRADAPFPRELAELADFPAPPLANIEEAEEARQAFLNLTQLLLTGGGTFRKKIDKSIGFPTDCPAEKARLTALIGSLSAVPGLESALAAVRELPPARYTEEDWAIVRACFTLLRQAAGELQVVFAEAAAVDFTEVSRIARQVLSADGIHPTEAALAISETIHHLLVDEFQDTSRRQYQLLAALIAAWPERPGRSCFAVGDPMQSVYFFRDADVDLFIGVQGAGLEIPNEPPLAFDPVSLTANFRTAPALVERLNQVFTDVFAANDGSGIVFDAAQPAREPSANAQPFQLHLRFVPSSGRSNPNASEEREAARQAQIADIVALIKSNLPAIEAARLAREAGEDRKFRVAVLGRAYNHLAPIALALREAGIPFRAVGLENLTDRPEVQDALALARALLNPLDRIAWLGVLRAPWCGLSLADLHAIAGNPAEHDRPIPELLALHLTALSLDGQPAASRVLTAIASAQTLRAAQPTASLGTWLEQVWLLLGRAACADATARANLSLLWNCLDKLPLGEEDLLGTGLDAALAGLTALPDPNASSDAGVQLMSIHKSKGLEFEVVIVPELQAGSGRGSIKLLSWLERGLAEPSDSGEITEFLVAPMQTKGADPGKAKAWVDSVYKKREAQETRRVLYVASTRAREELHFFARPAYKVEKDGSLGLVEPSGSLLATAWPALEAEVRARFELEQPAPAEAQIETLAAQADSNLLVMPAPAKLTILRRLPPGFGLAQSGQNPPGDHEPAASSFATGPASLFPRHEGGLLSRALGTAVHALLEELARLRATLDWPQARAAIQAFQPRIAAQARSRGADPAQAAQIAAEALQLALDATRDTVGAWILSPHPGAASEASWAGILGGALRSVRVDRVFQAGPTPCSAGDYWWVVDYKTAQPETAATDPQSTLASLRPLFAPQVEAYAEVLRNLHGADAQVRAALYYPRMALLDWWEM